MKIFYSPSYTVATHSFETTRKSRWISTALAQIERRQVTTARRGFARLATVSVKLRRRKGGASHYGKSALRLRKSA
jgi:hypothetical protein